MMGPWMMGPGGFSGVWGLWMIPIFAIWILVIVGIVIFVVWMIRRLARGEPGTVGDSALEILKRRYARGEINQEEYEQKKRDIA